MKHKLGYIALLVVPAALAVGVKVIVFDADSRNVGYLQVYATPEASVFVDAKPIGKTPLTSPLLPGQYTIKLIPIASSDNSTQPQTAWQGKVTITAHQYTFIRRELQHTEVESAGETLTVQKTTFTSDTQAGEIVVESEPQGAIVSFNGIS